MTPRMIGEPNGKEKVNGTGHPDNLGACMGTAMICVHIYIYLYTSLIRVIVGETHKYIYRYICIYI